MSARPVTQSHGVHSQDIGAKYPAWLEANKETEKPEDLARYREQLRHIQDMCALYEHEPDNFDAIYHKMQEVRCVSQAPQIRSANFGTAPKFAGVRSLVVSKIGSMLLMVRFVGDF